MALHWVINETSVPTVGDERSPDYPVTNIEMTTLPAVEGESSIDDQVLKVRASVLRQLRQAQRNLLALKSVTSLVKFLLEDFPENFGSASAELRLHDPDGGLKAQLPVHKLFGEALSLKSDSYALYQLYPDNPETTLIDLDDPRMFAVLPDAAKATGAVMMPLFDGNRLLGSYHLALVDQVADYSEHEAELFSMLGQLVAATLLRVVEYQRATQLSLVDPITEAGNLRAFRRDMLREIYWARRVDQPLSLLYMSLDGLEELCRSYGEVTCHFVQRRVSQRLCSDLRATDYIAHTTTNHFAVLLPACNEPHAHHIGERMRRDLDNFAIDDGRGAVLYITLSIGLVCWEPARHPVESSDRLASQMESEAEGAMQKAERAGGNRISVARLGLLMV